MWLHYNKTINKIKNEITQKYKYCYAYKININTFININKQQDETNVRLNKKFDEIDGIEYTDFELENEKFNIEIELKNIIKQLGHFPTQKELRELEIK